MENYDFPKNNMSWREMMDAKQKPERYSGKVGIILACAIVLPYLAMLIVKALDKALL